MLTNQGRSVLRCAVTLLLAVACTAVVVVWPDWMTELRAQTYYGPSSILIISGQSQSGVPGGTLVPFVVQTTPSQSGLAVTWSVTPGGGTFGGATSTITRTDATGQARATLTVGNLASIVVTASLEGGNSVLFFASCPTCTNKTPPPVPDAIAQIALAGLAQSSTLIPSAIIAARTQATNIGLRLLNLRRGGGGLSTSGLALNHDGETVALGSAASQMFTLLGKGGGASADPSPFGNIGVFVNGLGTFGDVRASSREPAFDFHTAGMTAGADYRVLPSLVLGGAFGYAGTRTEFDRDTGHMDAHTYALSAYAGYTLGGFHADGIVTYGWNDYSTERSFVLNAVTTTATSKPSGDQFAVSAAAGYDFSFGALTVGPSLRVNYINVNVDSYTEHGGPFFALKVKSQNEESLTTSLGGEISYAFSVPFGVLSPLMRFEWEHEYLASSRLISGTLVSDPGQALFRTPTDNPDRDYFNLGFGVTGTFPGGWSSFLYYETILGRSRTTNHTITFGMRYEF